MPLPVDVPVLGSFQGLKGDQGNTGTFAAATVETLPADAPATVRIDGPETAKRLHLGIPRGLAAPDALPADQATAQYLGAGTDSATGRKAIELFAPVNIVDRRPPLTDVASKARAGVCRAGLTGTSVESFNTSAVRVFLQGLLGLFGATNLQTINFGGISGNYDNVYQGWSRQRFGGGSYVRLRGDSSATPIVRGVYGDEVRIDFSQETDSAPFEIRIDGVSQGLIGQAGAQAYARRAVFSVPLGPHTVEVRPPAGSGFAYPEMLYARDTSARGFEWLDFTLGGSGIWNMTTLMARSGQQAAGIPIEGTNGLDAHFDRDDIDVWFVGHIINDRGHVAEFVANTNYAAEATRRRNIPIVFLVEPMYLYDVDADYRAMREHLLSLRRHPHVTIIDWHGAIYTPDDVTGFKDRYWPGADKTHPNQAAYDVLAAMLAWTAGVPAVPQKMYSDLVAAQQVEWNPLAGAGRRATIEGTQRTLPFAEGPATRALAPITATGFVGRKEQVYRVEVADNRAASRQAAIAASATSDEHGKYIEYPSSSLLNINVSWLTSTADEYMVVVRARGNVRAIASNPLRFISPEGTVMPITTASVSSTTLRQEVSGPPVTFAFGLRRIADGAANLSFEGRIYDITITKASVPVLDVI